jgi:hypothetical protein
MHEREGNVLQTKNLFSITALSKVIWWERGVGGALEFEWHSFSPICLTASLLWLHLCL